MKNRLASAVIAALTAGCVVGPDYRPPQAVPPGAAVPDRWRQGRAAAVHYAPTPAEWWRIFNDPALNRLMSDAASANLDVRQTLARIRDARAQRTAVIATGLPALDARGNLSRRYNNITGGAQSGGASPVGGGFGVGNQYINIFQSGFDAQWELDFFGGVRRAVEAADAAVQAEVENRRDIVVTVLAEVARHYLDLRANQQLLAVAETHLRSQQEVLELTKVRRRAGLASHLDEAEAQFAVAQTEAQLPDYRTLIQQAVHALGVLLGREPGALAYRLAAPAGIPAAPAAVIADLPSELLKRRPDIRRAERHIASANAAVGIATAELYPKVNLAAFLGVQNLRITDLTPVGKSWSAAATLTMPIFNWGKLNANIDSKKAQYQQACLAYQATVLTAFREVEDALAAYANERRRQAALAEAVAADRLAVDLAAERYRKGLTSFLDVLASQQALLKAETDQVASRAKLAGQLVVLYKSLGGGWVL